MMRRKVFGMGRSSVKDSESSEFRSHGHSRDDSSVSSQLSQELDFSRFWKNMKHTEPDDSPRASPTVRPSVPLQKFSYSELKKSTENFKESLLLSEDGSYGENLVYRGQLANGQLVAVKKYRRGSWKDADQFETLVERVSSFHHEGFVPLLGFCCDGDNHRLLVAEYMPLDTLDKHLLHWEKQPMAWEQRLSISIKVATVLRCLEKVEDLPLYLDINPYRVLFDKDCLPKISCFGLLKPPHGPGGAEEEAFSSTLLQLPPEFSQSGFTGVTPQTVVWCFGSLMVSLLSGKNLRPNQFLEFVRSGRASLLVDSSFALHRKFSDALLPLTAKCLMEDAGSRPTFGAVILFLSSLETKINQTFSQGIKQSIYLKELSGHGSSKQQLSETATAIVSTDMDSIFKILLKETEQRSRRKVVTLAYFKPSMLESFSAKEKGDKAFEAGQWPVAILEYQKVLKQRKSNLDFSFFMLRICFSYLHLADTRSALAQANDAVRTRPDFHLAYYMYALSLKQLGRQEDYRRALEKATFAENSF